MKSLSLRMLNRMTLARQLLLERADIGVSEALEQLAGLQAQAPRPPYIGLWTRLAGFERQELERLIENRAAVRATLMRGTLHLVTTKDFLQFRSQLAESLGRTARMIFKGPNKDSEIEKVLVRGRKILAGGPRTFGEMRPELAGHFPMHEMQPLTTAVRLMLPLVQVPGKGSWGFPTEPAFALAEDWLGQALPAKAKMEELIRRYLRAFGPAGIQDMQAWSGATGLKLVVERMRAELVSFQDETGRELFDLPELSAVDDGVSAPVRFLPEYDNLLLAHADRTRVLPEPYRRKIFIAPVVRASVLIDGFVQGRWRTEAKGKTATLVVEPFVNWNRKLRQEVQAEGERLLRFVHGELEGFEVTVGGVI